MIGYEKGIRKIKIPFKKKDFITLEGAKSILDKYLSKCLALHLENSEKEEDLELYYKGIQDIRFKTRMFKSDNSFNSQDVENHALAQVDFLTDYLLSEKVKFSNKNSDMVDKMSIFDKLMIDANYYTENMEVKKDMFKYGVGTQYVAPKTDIIDIDKDGNSTIVKGYAKDSEAPFVYSYLDPKYNFVVYSSYAGEEPLLAISLTDIAVGDDMPSYEIEIWCGFYYFKYHSVQNPQNKECTGNMILEFSNNFQPKKCIYQKLPIIETYCNRERLGIIEINRDSYNLINLIKSLSSDAVYDVVNQIFVFENVEIDGDQFDEMIANKCIKITSSGNADAKPDVHTISIAFNHSDVNVLLQTTIKNCYDIVGVPLASGNTGQGTTKGGQELGGGWENAQIKMNGRIVEMMKSDYEVLRTILSACKIIKGSQVNDIQSHDIDISYRLSVNDNILNKAQSATNLFSIHYPLEGILRVCRLSNDISSDAKKWQEEIDKADDKALKLQELATKKQIEDSQNSEDKKAEQEESSKEKNINKLSVKDIKKDTKVDAK